MKKFKKIPKFKNEKEEREFWATHDSIAYVDWSKGVETISLRLPKYLLARLKELANSKDVPYQSLMKVFLAERINREIGVYAES